MIFEIDKLFKTIKSVDKSFIWFFEIDKLFVVFLRVLNKVDDNFKDVMVVTFVDLFSK